MARFVLSIVVRYDNKLCRRYDDVGINSIFVAGYILKCV